MDTTTTPRDASEEPWYKGTEFDPLLYAPPWIQTTTGSCG